MSARFILDRRVALERYASLKALGLRVAYSVKTNPSVARALEEETDSEFTMHFMEPLDAVRDKSRVWYYAHAWEQHEIRALVEQGVRRFIVDNEVDLSILESWLASHDAKVDLLLRLRLKEHTVFTGRHYVFGMDADVVNARVASLRGNAAIRALGVHVHRKSQNVSEWSLREELGESLSEETWKAIGLVNIGGGMPAQYSNSSDGMVRAIFAKIREFVGFCGQRGISVMAEPGRYIAAPAVVLETTIKRISGSTVIVDASVYNSAMDTLIVPLKLLVEGELPEGEGKSYTIKGCTPCSMDIFRYSVRLREPKAGGTIRFLNAGAYNFRTEFCGLPELETISAGL